MSIPDYPDGPEAPEAMPTEGRLDAIINAIQELRTAFNMLSALDATHPDNIAECSRFAKDYKASMNEALLQLGVDEPNRRRICNA